MAKKKKKKNNSARIGILALAVVLVIGLLVGLKFCSKKPDDAPEATTAGQTQATTAQPVLSINPLTGEPDESGSLATLRPIAVVISNAPKARPQWGLCSPDVIFEGVTEGGVTRMLGLYATTDNIPKVGPIRSARHDFVEIAEGYDSIFVHWGGSTRAYEELKRNNVNDLDGIKYVGKYFFRDDSRTNVGVEHRSYTKGSALAQGIADRGYRTAVKDSYAYPFHFAKSAFTPDSACNSVSFVLSGSVKHTFTYDPATGLYGNELNGKPMKDAKGDQMQVNNVILIYPDVSVIDEKAGLVDMRLSSGEGIFVTKGGTMPIKWKKGDSSDMLRFFNTDGSDLELNTGKTYVGLVPKTNQSKTVIA